MHSRSGATPPRPPGSRVMLSSERVGSEVVSADFGHVGEPLPVRGLGLAESEVVERRSRVTRLLPNLLSSRVGF
jgi:hypothetical protein